MIVVDTNVIAAFYLDLPSSPFATRAFDLDSAWVTPILWRSEFRNVLVKYVRAGILTTEKAIRIVTEAEHEMGRNDYVPNSAQVLQLAAISPCSAYDCEFVAIAQELGVRLVSLDQEILANFPGTAVSLIDFAA